MNNDNSLTYNRDLYYVALHTYDNKCIFKSSNHCVAMLEKGKKIAIITID